jgi:hypothetical protein
MHLPCRVASIGTRFFTKEARAGSYLGRLSVRNDQHSLGDAVSRTLAAARKTVSCYATVQVTVQEELTESCK